MKRAIFALTWLMTIAGPAGAQMDHGAHAGHGGQMQGMFGPYPAGREASGTAWLPESSPHGGRHATLAGWSVMTHGYVSAIFDHQGGRRGDTETLSQSMIMSMAQRPLGHGTVGLRAMLSLDPLMGKSGYPLLLQTGETADGVTPLVDRQHPHDLFMELALSYALHLGRRSSVFFYAGLPGEPALGPAAFMHRFSGVENPEAPLSHHWLDSTHVTFGVLTVGGIWRGVKAEASGFRGREPDEERWDMESPRIDSWSARLTLNPARNWSMQVSRGDLHAPEQLEPDEDVRRWTASVTHNRPFAGGDNVQTTLAWGENQPEDGAPQDALLVETAWRFHDRNTVFGRAENIDNGELFGHGGHHGGRVYNVSKATLGYLRDIVETGGVRLGVGGTLSAHFLPSSLEHEYGELPLGTMIFVRLALN